MLVPKFHYHQKEPSADYRPETGRVQGKSVNISSARKQRLMGSISRATSRRNLDFFGFS